MPDLSTCFDDALSAVKAGDTRAVTLFVTRVREWAADEQLRGGKNLSCDEITSRALSQPDQSPKRATLLHWAALLGSTHIATILVRNGANVDAAETDGKLPLHWAAFEGHHEICQLLLSAGSDFLAEDALQQTPCHLALLRRHYDVARIFPNFISASASVDPPGLKHSHSMNLSIAAQTDNDFLRTVASSVAAEPSSPDIRKPPFTASLSPTPVDPALSYDDNVGNRSPVIMAIAAAAASTPAERGVATGSSDDERMRKRREKHEEKRRQLIVELLSVPLDQSHNLDSIAWGAANGERAGVPKRIATTPLTPTPTAKRSVVEVEPRLPENQVPSPNVGSGAELRVNPRTSAAINSPLVPPLATWKNLRRQASYTHDEDAPRFRTPSRGRGGGTTARPRAVDPSERAVLKDISNEVINRQVPPRVKAVAGTPVKTAKPLMPPKAAPNPRTMSGTRGLVRTNTSKNTSSPGKGKTRTRTVSTGARKPSTLPKKSLVGNNGSSWKSRTDFVQQQQQEDRPSRPTLHKTAPPPARPAPARGVGGVPSRFTRTMSGAPPKVPVVSTGSAAPQAFARSHTVSTDMRRMQRSPQGRAPPRHSPPSRLPRGRPLSGTHSPTARTASTRRTKTRDADPLASPVKSPQSPLSESHGRARPPWRPPSRYSSNTSTPPTTPQKTHLERTRSNNSRMKRKPTKLVFSSTASLIPFELTSSVPITVTSRSS